MHRRSPSGITIRETLDTVDIDADRQLQKAPLRTLRDQIPWIAGFTVIVTALSLTQGPWGSLVGAIFGTALFGWVSSASAAGISVRQRLHLDRHTATLTDGDRVEQLPLESIADVCTCDGGLNIVTHDQTLRVFSHLTPTQAGWLSQELLAATARRRRALRCSGQDPEQAAQPPAALQALLAHSAT